jgi:hypothetical protein
MAVAAGCGMQLRSTDPLEPARSLAQAERDFAAQSVREDARRAFLANFADDGVLVRNTWVRAIATLSAQASTPNVLDWHPAYVEAARSGELGLSTGPWTMASREGRGASAHGDFVSVWRRDAGRWRVIADIGIAHGDASGWTTPLEMHLAGPEETGACGAIDAAEQAFAHAASASGIKGALREYGARDVRFYREGQPVLRGSGNALAGVVADEAPRCEVEASQVARSGELAYARGSYVSQDGSARGTWLRVWRCESGRWRTTLDVANAAR